MSKRAPPAGVWLRRGQCRRPHLQPMGTIVRLKPHGAFDGVPPRGVGDQGWNRAGIRSGRTPAGGGCSIEAEATARIGAEWGEHTDTRTTWRDGHREKTLTTQAGDLDPAIPKMRTGSFFPSLLERRRRIDQALYAVIVEAYVRGVSTRSVDDLVKALGADTGISKSEVSRICGELDEPLAAFRTRPLDHTRFPYIYLDATYCEVRVNHQIRARLFQRFETRLRWKANPPRTAAFTPTTVRTPPTAQPVHRQFARSTSPSPRCAASTSAMTATSAAT
jgi:hypothetical protein